MYRVKGSPNQGLLGATIGFFFGFAAVSLFGPTSDRFDDVMELSPVLVGLLVAMPSLSGSLLRIPFSAWVETNGGRKPFLILLGLSVVGMLGLTLVVYLLYPDAMSIGLYPVLLVLGLLSGCGIATFSVGISQVSYWFPQDRQGWALGSYAGFGNLAPGIFSFLIPVVLGSLGLGGSYLAWLLLLSIGIIAYHRLACNARCFQFVAQGASWEEGKQLARSQGQELFPAGSPSESLLLSARVWRTWLLVLLYFTTFGGFLALTAWFPTYWRSFFATSAITAGGLTAVYSILSSGIRVPGGSIADRIGGANTALLALVVLLVGSIAMVVSRSFGLSVAGAILMAMGMGVNNAAVFKLVPREVPHAIGGAAGWVGGLGAFGGFAIPPVMGSFVGAQDDVGYATGFVVFTALAVMSLCLAWVLRRTGSVPDEAAVTGVAADREAMPRKR